MKPLYYLKNNLLNLESRQSNPVIQNPSNDCLVSFESVKRIISNAVLVIPNREEDLILKPNASGTAIASILTTTDGRPVTFHSRILTKTEERYDVLEKEAVAIFWGIQRCKMFLIGRKFVVETDHKPCQYLFNEQKVSNKIMRWRIKLQQYNFEVRYINGKIMLLLTGFLECSPCKTFLNFLLITK